MLKAAMKLEGWLAVTSVFICSPCWAGVSRMTDCACEAFSGFPKLRLRCADLERLLSTREV